MEDRRIKKTKKNLKATLIEMLSDMTFEQVTITDLCKRADISRITFYTHYNDKYALVDDIFHDMIRIGTTQYRKMQHENNPERNLTANYRNVLYTILDLYYDNYDFFRHTRPGKNPFLAFSFYNYVLKTIEAYTDREGRTLNLRYSARKIAGFLCYGIVGFINECHAENMSLEQIREEASALLTSILTSDIIME